MDKSTLNFSEADAQITFKHFKHHRDYQNMLATLAKDCEKEVIQALKNATERYVTCGGTVEHPKVIIDMQVKEFRVLYGFSEELCVYRLALTRQGFKYNPKLRSKQTDGVLFAHNPKFDVSMLRF